MDNPVLAFQDGLPGTFTSPYPQDLHFLFGREGKDGLFLRSPEGHYQVLFFSGLDFYLDRLLDSKGEGGEVFGGRRFPYLDFQDFWNFGVFQDFLDFGDGGFLIFGIHFISPFLFISEWIFLFLLWFYNKG
jgi:hypothetical protein